MRRADRGMVDGRYFYGTRDSTKELVDRQASGQTRAAYETKAKERLRELEAAEKVLIVGKSPDARPLTKKIPLDFQRLLFRNWPAVAST